MKSPQFPRKAGTTLRNGELLQAMNLDGIEYLVTADKNLSYQQNYRKWDVVKLIVRIRLIISMKWCFHLSRKSNYYLNRVLIQDYNWIDS